MIGQNPRAIGAQSRMRLPQLAPFEPRVVDAITSRENITVESSLNEVANESSVSEVMIVKNTEKLRFWGYRELRGGLVDYQQSEVANLFREISSDDCSASVIQGVFQTSMQALDVTNSILDVAASDRAADIMHPPIIETLMAPVDPRKLPAMLPANSYASACEKLSMMTPI